MVAARMATLKHGSNQHRNVEGQICLSTQPFELAPKTIEKAARIMKIGTKTVKMARAVLAHGTPEEIAAVDKGDATVSATARRWGRPVPVLGRWLRPRPLAGGPSTWRR